MAKQETPEPDVPQAMQPLEAALLAPLRPKLADYMATGNAYPVATWPKPTGDSKITICRNGDWLHEGQKITRPALLRLFACLLRRDAEGAYWLVTPAECAAVKVEDSPFLITAMHDQPPDDMPIAAADNLHPALWLQTNLGYWFRLDQDHPLAWWVPPQSTIEAGAPYVRIRDDLWARLKPAVYYDLAARVQETLGSDGASYYLETAGQQLPFPVAAADREG